MSAQGSVGTEFANGLVRGMGQAAGSAWYTSKWLYVVIILVFIYYLHSHPPEMFMRHLTPDSSGYDQFVGIWYSKRESTAAADHDDHTDANSPKHGRRVIEFHPDAKTFSKGKQDFEMEDPLIYAIAGNAKMRFDAELVDDKLSHVFVTAHGKSITISIDGGRGITYWKDKRLA